MGTSSSHTAPTGGSWPRLKSIVRRFASQGGTEEGPVTARQVTAAYVAAMGGAETAAKAATSAIAGGANLLSFLSQSSSEGLSAALASRGLDIVGRSATEILAALADSLSDGTDTIDESVSRRAALDVLDEKFKQATSFEELEAILGPTLSSEEIGVLLERFLVRYIFLKMLNVIKERIELGTTSTNEALNVERNLKDFVAENVQFELRRINARAFDGETPEAKEMIERLLREAYLSLGAGA